MVARTRQQLERFLLPRLRHSPRRRQLRHVSRAKIPAHALLPFGNVRPRHAAQQSETRQRCYNPLRPSADGSPSKQHVTSVHGRWEELQNTTAHRSRFPTDREPTQPIRIRRGVVPESGRKTWKTSWRVEFGKSGEETRRKPSVGRLNRHPPAKEQTKNTKVRANRNNMLRHKNSSLRSLSPSAIRDWQ